MKKYLLLVILLSAACGAAIAQPLPPVSTFSIVAIDSQTGEQQAQAARYPDGGGIVTGCPVTIWVSSSSRIRSIR